MLRRPPANRCGPGCGRAGGARPPPGHGPRTRPFLTANIPTLTPRPQPHGQVGEIMGGRYQVFATHGKGVFSTVLRARDTRAGASGAGGGPGGAAAAPAEVAIKVIRANDLMTRAGHLEAVICNKLAAADPAGRRHCVRLLSSFEYRRHLCLVFEPLVREGDGRDLGGEGGRCRRRACARGLGPPQLPATPFNPPQSHATSHFPILQGHQSARADQKVWPRHRPVARCRACVRRPAAGRPAPPAHVRRPARR